MMVSNHGPKKTKKRNQSICHGNVPFSCFLEKKMEESDQFVTRINVIIGWGRTRVQK